LAPKVVAIRFAVGKGKKRIDGGGCETFSAILPARSQCGRDYSFAKAHAFVLHSEFHFIPKNFMRIRHFGFLANRSKRQMLPQCRKLLDLDPALPRCSIESAKDLL